MSDTEWYREQANEAFNLIVKDGQDRQGWDMWWPYDDEETQNEIRDAWCEIMIKAFEI